MDSPFRRGVQGSRTGTLRKVATLVFAGAVLLVALYIMVRGLGLADGYDFGAGAYYYADIPDYENVVPGTDGANPTSTPSWIYYLLFLVWGGLMWWLWKIIDRQ